MFLVIDHAVRWLNPDFETLAVNGQRLFDFRFGTFQGSSDELIYDCAARDIGRTCYALRQFFTTTLPVTFPSRLEDVRRARPAPGRERLAFVATACFGCTDTVLVWDPGQGSARALTQFPALGENMHVLGSVAGALALVSTLGGGSFHLVPLEGPQAPAFFPFPANSESFTVLGSRFLYNKAEDLKFYRLQPPLQATALPAKLANLPDGTNPIGDYHAIQVTGGNALSLLP